MEGIILRRAILRAILASACLVGLSGCDYWPPALQTQIEQLRSELQAATMEKAQLQNQAAAAIKAKEDLQAQVDELTRLNREKTAMLTTLQTQLAAERERTAKLAKTAVAKAPVKSPAKSAAKVPTKAAPKKKPTKAATAQRH